MPGASLTFTTRNEGDFRIDGDPAALAARRRSVRPGDWTWLRQVHGARVVVVTEPGEHAGADADAAVTGVAGAVLAVHTADCAPVLLYGNDHAVVGAAHVGWRGLVAGILDATVDAMGALGAHDLVAVVGPHIRARCYEFGADDLDTAARHCGEDVRATTAWGTPALDVSAGIRSILAARPEIRLVLDEPGCTACEPGRYYSHRARADTGRHAALISMQPPVQAPVPA